MSDPIRLFLPVLFPSWRFFGEIGASPRVQFRPAGGTDWQHAVTRPSRLPLPTRLLRLVWNPGWNEALFLAALAERQAVEPADWIGAEIARRVARRHGLARLPDIRVVFVTPGGRGVAGDDA
ncbi:hypothetical protein HKCCE2091_15850 [Rhodobacterales bacterium HKCCE2091]|nr:hypothetical protein [Rhodobacterales bacterium HKCCE2091]